MQRGNAIEQMAPAEIARFKKATEGVSQAWIADVSKKGVDGKKLYEEANALVTKYARMN